MEARRMRGDTVSQSVYGIDPMVRPTRDAPGHAVSKPARPFVRPLGTHPLRLSGRGELTGPNLGERRYDREQIAATAESRRIP